MLIGSTAAFIPAMIFWYYDKITTRQMVGLTLALSFIALQFSAVTTLFVS
jgi:hypothetical protein